MIAIGSETENHPRAYAQMWGAKQIDINVSFHTTNPRQTAQRSARLRLPVSFVTHAKILDAQFFFFAISKKY
jgi:hypothetical protein